MRVARICEKENVIIKDNFWAKAKAKAKVKSQVRPKVRLPRDPARQARDRATPKKMPSPNRCNQSAARSPASRASYGASSGRISVRSHGIHLNLWAFPSPSERPFSSSGSSRDFGFVVTAIRVRYFADGPESFVPNRSSGSGSRSSLCETIFRTWRKNYVYMLLKLYRGVPARDSAPPLHVRVPPREFDGLPSAGAAPALWTGTQEPQGTVIIRRWTSGRRCRLVSGETFNVRFNSLMNYIVLLHILTRITERRTYPRPPIRPPSCQAIRRLWRTRRTTNRERFQYSTRCNMRDLSVSLS